MKFRIMAAALALLFIVSIMLIFIGLKSKKSHQGLETPPVAEKAYDEDGKEPNLHLKAQKINIHDEKIEVRPNALGGRRSKSQISFEPAALPGEKIIWLRLSPSTVGGLSSELLDAVVKKLGFQLGLRGQYLYRGKPYGQEGGSVVVGIAKGEDQGVLDPLKNSLIESLVLYLTFPEAALSHQATFSNLIACFAAKLSTALGAEIYNEHGEAWMPLPSPPHLETSPSPQLWDNIQASPWMSRCSEIESLNLSDPVTSEPSTESEEDPMHVQSTKSTEPL